MEPTNIPHRNITKAQRLIMMMELHDRGLMKTLSLSDLQREYFPGTDRSTLSRDRAALPLLLQRIADIK